MILMLAPGPNMSLGAMPSGANFVSDYLGLVKITNDSAADQAGLAAIGCATLSPFGNWGTFGFDTLADLYAADMATNLVLPGVVGFPQFTLATVFDDDDDTGTWLKTNTGHGAGNWTQVSTETAITAAAAAEAAAAAAAASAADAEAAGTVNTATLAAMESAGRGLQLFSGTDDIQPIVAGHDYGIVLGFSQSTGFLYAALDPMGGALYRAVIARALSFTAPFRTYSGTERVQPLVSGHDGGVFIGVDTLNGVVSGSGMTGFAPRRSRGDLLTTAKPVLTDWNGFISYGQSNSLGQTTDNTVFVPLSTAQPYSNLTFGAGPRSAKNGSASGATYVAPGTSTTKALVEDATTQPYGGLSGKVSETVCSGMANGAVEQAAIENGIAPTAFVIFSSAPGHGAYMISQLNAAATWWADFTEHLNEAKARATTAGKVFACHAVAWVQGESDAELGTSYATYKAAIKQLATDIDTTVRGITSQSTPCYTLVVQPAYEVIPNSGQVAQAQLDACAESSLLFMVSPVYHLPHCPDTTHYTNVGNLRLGRTLGRAYKQLVIDGREPDFILPLSATARGTTLTVKFKVPLSPLQLDTTLLHPVTQLGFALSDGTGAVTLSNIMVVNGDTIQMTLSRSLGSSPVLRYARDAIAALGPTILGGAGGNLRDSTDDTFSHAGTTYPLWHVCPSFSLNITPLDVS
jgi:hypothetical protein